MNRLWRINSLKTGSLPDIGARGDAAMALRSILGQVTEGRTVALLQLTSGWNRRRPQSWNRRSEHTMGLASSRDHVSDGDYAICGGSL